MEESGQDFQEAYDNISGTGLVNGNLSCKIAPLIGMSMHILMAVQIVSTDIVGDVLLTPFIEISSSYDISSVSFVIMRII